MKEKVNFIINYILKERPEQLALIRLYNDAFYI
jgi:hypothetical protein